jgi:hypothetical protein
VGCYQTIALCIYRDEMKKKKTQYNSYITDFGS